MNDINKAEKQQQNKNRNTDPNNSKRPDERGGNSGNNTSKKKRTSSFKHVSLDRKRPQLSREQDAGDRRKKNNNNNRKNQRKTSSSKDPNAKLEIIPLGGLDAIGKNMTAFECKGDMILDDAGLMFPDDDHPGIDLILPDYTYVLENADKLKGIVITHGHEDHTGSLPYLMKDLDRMVPIYATKLTLGLIEGKFAEHRIKNAKLIEVKAGDVSRLAA